MTVDTVLALTVWVPLVGALLVVATGRWPNLREAMTILTAIVLFSLVVRLLGTFSGDAAVVESVLAEPIPGIPLALTVEPLGMVFALVASFLWVVTSVYAIGYMRGHDEPHQTRFYACFAVALSSAMGIAFSANLLTLFVFYEVLTLSTYPLVTHTGTQEARKAGRLYLGILLSTSIGLLMLAMLWTWNLSGTLDFVPGGILAGKADAGVAAVLFALYAFGAGKAALMPFHRWLPAAMVAPTPVSALLHAVAVVKAGVFTVLKVTVYIFGLDFLAETQAAQWLLYVAAATILIGSLVAMTKDNLKARLAYSTISQLSYVLLGGMLANTAGVAGATMHIAMHAFGKITLFFCAGAIMVAAHKTRISEMSGLGRRMPLTMVAFLIGSLSIIGLPPSGGTWSKWFLILGTLDAGNLVLLGVLMLSSLLSIAYLLPVPVRGFFGKPSAVDEGQAGVHEAPIPCLIAIAVTMLGCVVLFLYPEPLYELALLVTR